MMNLKIYVKGELDSILKELVRIGISLCDYSLNGNTRVIYVSEIANEAFGAYKSSLDMDRLFDGKEITLSELKLLEVLK